MSEYNNNNIIQYNNNNEKLVPMQNISSIMNHNIREFNKIQKNSQNQLRILRISKK